MKHLPRLFHTYEGPHQILWREWHAIEMFVKDEFSQSCEKDAACGMANGRQHNGILAKWKRKMLLTRLQKQIEANRIINVVAHAIKRSYIWYTYTVHTYTHKYLPFDVLLWLCLCAEYAGSIDFRPTKHPYIDNIKYIWEIEDREVERAEKSEITDYGQNKTKENPKMKAKPHTHIHIHILISNRHTVDSRENDTRIRSLCIEMIVNQNIQAKESI